MKAFIIAVLLLWSITAAKAQHAKEGLDSSMKMSNEAISSGIVTTPCQGLRVPSANEQNWNKRLVNLEMRHKNPEVDEVERIKREQQLLKKEFNGQKVPFAQKSLVVNPVLGTNFMGNPNNGMTPADNNVAVSNGGRIVSVVNTSAEYDQTNGTNLYLSGFSDFFNDPQLTGSIYDPVVVYDSAADRFIMAVLHGTTSSNSLVLVCFSKTNNPSDGWWVYYLTGNPLNQGHWFDYPKIAVSNNEVYVTGNLFTNQGQFATSVIYQINKASGYNGTNLNWQYWHSLAGSPFTLLPLSWGQQGNYGPGVLLVAGGASGGSSYNLYDLTNDLGSNPSINHYVINVSPYGVAAPADQAGSNETLDNGDCRFLSGFYLDGVVHFVHTANAGNGWNGLNYNRLTLSTLSNISQIYGFPGNTDFCYPSVASFSNSVSDKSVCIAFQASNNNIFPQCRAVAVDNNFNWSNDILVKAGVSHIDFVNGNERWGDYTGIARKHNAATPTVWTSLAYGSQQNAFDTWIAEIIAGNSTSAENTSFTDRSQLAFPNPVQDQFSLRFIMPESAVVDVAVYDMSGKMVKLLFHDRARAGENLLSFNASPLSHGTYIVKVSDNQKIYLNEKINVVR
jgi:hypothetical protein